MPNQGNVPSHMGLAENGGLEPPIHESKSCVLPLHQFSSKKAGAVTKSIAYCDYGIEDSPFYKFVFCGQIKVVANVLRFCSRYKLSVLWSVLSLCQLQRSLFPVRVVIPPVFYIHPAKTDIASCGVTARINVHTLAFLSAYRAIHLVRILWVEVWNHLILNISHISKPHKLVLVFHRNPAIT